MEAAALYAFARAANQKILCLAHVTNTMAVAEHDFEKGEADGTVDALRVLDAIVGAFLIGAESTVEKHEKAPEEIADNERTNPMGLFNFAEAYWRAAQALSAKTLKGGFADSPVRTLYYHAIELYLKALLRQHYSVDELQNKFRHSIKRMKAKAERHGLSLMDEDREVLALMKGDVLIRARYIRTGFFTFPTLEALDRTCKSLRESVGKLLHNAGVKVRL